MSVICVNDILTLNNAGVSEDVERVSALLSIL